MPVLNVLNAELSASKTAGRRRLCTVHLEAKTVI
jgi:hypothetical protein